MPSANTKRLVTKKFDELLVGAAAIRVERPAASTMAVTMRGD